MHTASSSEAALSRADRRAVLASAVGNCLELFDLTVFGFFAAVIGAQFFPSNNPLVSILSSFATFALGFLMRPAGALLLAPLGDKLGRKTLLSLTMMLMGLASLGIGILPDYATIGLAAPLLLILLRLIQGFAAGGEWGGAVSMMVEHAPETRRGFIGSFQQVGFGLGILLGTLFAWGINNGLSPAQVQAWGWRLPFLFGALVTPIALLIRHRVSESPEYQKARQKGEVSAHPLSEVWKYHRRGVLCVVGIGTLGTAAGYIANQFMSNFAVGTLGLPAGKVSLAIMLASVLQTVLIPFWGWVSDKVGRLQVIGGAAFIYLIIIYPLFSALAHMPSMSALIILTFCCAIVISASFGPLPALISELFPATIRTTAISVGYNLAAALFGGCAPLVSAWLIAVSGSLVSPSWYALACAIITTATCFGLLRRRTLLIITERN